MSAVMRGFERDTLSVVWQSKRVWLAHVTLNLALIAAFYLWLLIPDRRGWQIGVTAIAALIWLTIALWLHASTFQYFSAAHNAPEAWTISWRRSARNIPAFAILFALLIALIWAWGMAMDYLPQIGGWVRHLLPAFVRTHVSVRVATQVLHVVVIVIFPFLLPLYLWPFIREAAVRGFGAFVGGWASAARSFWHLRWWATWLILFLLAHLPFHLAFPKHQPATLAMQAASAAFRLTIAWLLLNAVYMLVLSAVGRLRRNEIPAAAEPVPTESAPKL